MRRRVRGIHGIALIRAVVCAVFGALTLAKRGAPLLSAVPDRATLTR